jgi:hypothetical protein
MRAGLMGAVLAVALTSPVLARAQESDLARADALFNAAKALLDSGQNAEACATFAQSRALAPGLGVTMYLADCYERIGRIASAWQEFRTAEGLARERNDKRADLARDRAQALEPKLNRLVVTVAPTVPHADLQLLLDGLALAPEAWGLPFPVDPGDHVIVVRSQGRTRRTIATHLGSENPNTSIRIDSLDEPAVPAPTRAPMLAPETMPSPDTSPSPEVNPGGAQRWIGIGTGIAGIAGIGVGSALGLAAKSKLDQSNSSTTLCETSPGDYCTPAGESLRKSTEALATGSTVFFVIGAAAVAGGIVIYLTAPHAPSPGASVAVAPAALPGGGGALVRATF